MALKNNTSKSIASVTKSLYQGETNMELTVFALNEKVFHCNALKDMSAISVESSKKLHKNAVNMAQVAEEANSAGILLNDKIKNLEERAERNGESDELMEERKNLTAEVKKHNEAKYPVSVFCLQESEFPKEDKEKYGLKKISNNGGTIEWSRFDSFLELYGNIIIPTEDSDV